MTTSRELGLINAIVCDVLEHYDGIKDFDTHPEDDRTTVLQMKDGGFVHITVSEVRQGDEPVCPQRLCGHGLSFHHKLRCEHPDCVYCDGWPDRFQKHPSHFTRPVPPTDEGGANGE